MTVLAPAGKRKSWYYDIQIKGKRFHKGGFPSRQEAEEAQQQLKSQTLLLNRETISLDREKIHSQDSVRIGDRTEGIILATLLAMGKNVLIPFNHSLRYDMAIEMNGKCVRIQCKTGRLKAAAIGYHAAPKSRHYMGHADYFAIYCRQTHGIYLVPVSTGTNGHLPLEKAQEYEVGKFILNRKSRDSRVELENEDSQNADGPIV